MQTRHISEKRAPRKAAGWDDYNTTTTADDPHNS